ncbi:alpha,alpha-trehalase [Escherichia coli]|uniref:alpha,alpha-trehalase n=1 Tax=Escherichia coli TaxID=562 RepID=UPI0010CC392D|nr:alpha,alpha-trehalase [Escherichia coli]EIE2983450.1 alpha,alpha-trehalase [Escherichia coli]ELO3137898.1 alpha,alpha-trehalase [Escherichia coli]MCN6744520.1 alpha,alpha-trehalase [Escherichia coli]MCN8882033.1 alpha,alpha-trehalase [Escherichia coli]GCW58714.1 periplasmic trehalase [Escherichia coli]
MKSLAPSRPQKMALIPACIFLCFAALSVQAEETSVTPQPPDILLGPLFNDVQNAKLFPDQKIFADAVPNSDPLMILADYRMQQHQSGFDLRHFVNVNFTLPKEGEKYVPPEGQSLREHIDGLWPVLTRSTENTEKWDSLLPLPKPYVVPGGRFREVYYWDSYFTMLGLAESGHWDKVADMVANFAHEIDTYGHIPNGNRSYYLSRSQPPFFALMVELLAQHEGDAALKQYLPQMQKEYAYWMDGVENLQAGQQEKRVVKLQDGTLLNRYWDDRDTPRPESWVEDIATAKSNPNRPATEIYRDLRSAAASGWDFSSRWMDNPQQLNTLRTTSIVPVDLNSLMFKMEKILARASKAIGDNAMANQYETLANARQKGIEKYLWNDQQGWYADYDLKSHKVRNQLTAAALFPLYVNAAAKDRASKMATATKTHLLQPGGLNTTSVKSGQQWDAPNGWAPLQWVATEGLQNYGQKEVAMDISWHFLTNVQHTYDREKKLVEKYDVSTTGTGGGGGEYPLQDGFGWTNGVTLKMLDLICPKEQPCDNVPATRPLSESTTQPLKQKEAEPTP